MKHFSKSKTLWFNASLGAIAALEGSFQVLQPHMPVDVFAGLTVVLAVGNAMLRTITSASIQLKG